MDKQIVEVPSIYEPAGQYNHAIIVSGGHTVYLSGVVGKRPDGTIPESDIGAQSELAYKNLREVMRAAGGDLDDMVKVNVYVGEDFATHLAELRAIRSRYLTADFPVSTLVRAAGFAGPEYLFEIEAIAVLPEEDGWSTIMSVAAALEVPRAWTGPHLRPRARALRSARRSAGRGHDVRLEHEQHADLQRHVG